MDIDAETEVAILYGTKTGLVELPLAIMNEGELLLLPDPGSTRIIYPASAWQISAMKRYHCLPKITSCLTTEQCRMSKKRMQS